MTELLAAAESVVAKAKAAGATQAECWVVEGAGVEIDIEADKVAGANTSSSRGSAVRVVSGGRLGFAYFTDPDTAGAAIERALAMSRLAPRKRYRLPSSQSIKGLDRWHDDVAALDEAIALEWCRDAIAAMKDECGDASVVGGGAGFAWDRYAVASSEGVAAADRSTHASIGLSVALEDGDTALNTWDADMSHDLAIDPSALGTRVATTVARLRDPKKAKEGRHDIVLLPDAAAQLISAGVLPAVDGDRAARGNSVWSERLAEVVAHPGLTITDDPLDPLAIGGSSFDGEGVGVQRRPVIEEGALKTFLFDSWTAHEHQTATTGNAVRGDFKAPPTTGAHHVVVEHANTVGHEALLRDVDSGYLVESLLGAHTMNATTGDFSVTAPNVWRIEKGEVVAASEGVAVAGNLPRLLQHLDAVDDKVVRRDGMTMPAVRIRDVSISA